MPKKNPKRSRALFASKSSKCLASSPKTLSPSIFPMSTNSLGRFSVTARKVNYRPEKNPSSILSNRISHTNPCRVPTDSYGARSPVKPLARLQHTTCSPSVRLSPIINRCSAANPILLCPGLSSREPRGKLGRPREINGFFRDEYRVSQTDLNA